MSAKLFPYPEKRAIEDAAFARGVTPTRFHRLLLPVWKVTIRATVTVAEDYDLIDRYLSRGIAEGGLATTAELADFFRLEPVLVDRALRALEAIGHVRRTDGRWWLTEVGLWSVREGKRYAVVHEDRRELYFDAFGSRPLTKPYYDARRITLLPAGDGPAYFDRLHSFKGFDVAALTALSRDPERTAFNLPERIDDPQQLGPPDLVYLPLLAVRGVERIGTIRYLAYNQAGGEADPWLGGLLMATPEVVRTLENEQRGAKPADDEAQVRHWASGQGLSGHRVVRLPSGLVRVVLPAGRFGEDGLPLHDLGSFVVRRTSLFQPWCDDERVRRRALLSRVDQLLSTRSRVEAQRARIGQVARQLDLGGIDVPELRRMALRAGRQDLATRLEALE